MEFDACGFDAIDVGIAVLPLLHPILPQDTRREKAAGLGGRSSIFPHSLGQTNNYANVCKTPSYVLVLGSGDARGTTCFPIAFEQKY